LVERRLPKPKVAGSRPVVRFMLVSRDRSRVISTMGWVDQASLWVFHVGTGRITREVVGEGGHLRLYPGVNGFFAAAHHRDDEALAGVSVRHADAPGENVASLRFENGEVKLEGDHRVWSSVPRAYSARGVPPGSSAGAAALFVSPDGQGAALQTLEWFNEDTYDLMYQGLMTPVAVPGRAEVIFPVQRSSSPVLYDPASRKVVRRIALADRSGNPSVAFRWNGAEMWADDYDTLLRLDPRDWSVRDQIRLQGADKGTQQFIGDWCFTADESQCLIARPFSADVVVLDAVRFKVVARASVGGQPLQAALLSDGRVIARDWKSGELLTGQLTRARRFGLF
jgi:hypothetical protein